MKTCFLIIALIFNLTSGHLLKAQNSIVPDERLSVKYNHEYLTNLVEKSPEVLDYLNFCLDNSCYFITDDKDKFRNCQSLRFIDNTNKSVSEISINSIDQSNFNIFLYDFELNYSQRTFYRVGNTNQIVAFFSLKEMADRYNQFKKSVK